MKPKNTRELAGGVGCRGHRVGTVPIHTLRALCGLRQMGMHVSMHVSMHDCQWVLEANGGVWPLRRIDSK